MTDAPTVSAKLLLWLPVLLTLVLMAVLSAPALVPYGPWLPALPMMAVWFWRVYDPRCFGVMAILLLGVVADVLMGTPLGVQLVSVVLLSLIMLSLGKPISKQPFRVVWLLASLGFVVLTCVQTVLMQLVGLHTPDVLTLLQHALVSVAWYPLVHGFYFLVHRALPPLATR